MATTEPTVNTYLAQTLRTMHPRWSEKGAIVSQATGVLEGGEGRQPDILVRVHDAGPLVIEAEFHPARSLEDDALSRVGATTGHPRRPIETVVALRYPRRLRGVAESELAETLAACDDLAWCVWREGAGEVRFPNEGWLVGGLADLAGTVETLAVSPRRLDDAADRLQYAVEEGAGLISETGAATERHVAECLHQEAGRQTTRMAASIILNAFLFQIAVASSHGTPTIEETAAASGDPERLSKPDVLDAWGRILEINYWPVFEVARRLLLPIERRRAEHLCDRLALAAATLAGAGAVEVQDLAGQMFGRLIADRKFLATFYTLPESAALLAEMAVARLDGRVDWSDEVAVTDLRIGDLACGTGALLSAVYRRVVARVRRAGRDDAAIHAAMMQEALIGADIMPAAAHLTTTMLCASHPAVGFGKCGVHVLPFGRTPDGRVAVGSLDLLGDAGTLSLLGRPGTRLAGRFDDEEPDDDLMECNVGDGTLDLCIMNPPFTRPTNHETAQAAGVPVPSFAGFGATSDDQRAMSARLAELTPGGGSARAGHGNAGLASNFVDLAHAKLRPGGVLALILPFAAVSGRSWEGLRRLLASQYCDVSVTSIATHGSTARAFSADTGMAEIALVAVKRPATAAAAVQSPVDWISLARRPATITEAVQVARAIDDRGEPKGTPAIEIGHDRAGCVLPGAISQGGLTGVTEPEVAACGLALSRSAPRLPRVGDLPIPMAPLGETGRPGPVHRDISGTDKTTGAHRGPFDVKPLVAGRTPTYPVLWAHEAGSGRESQIEVRPDTQGRVRFGMEEEALAVWESSTRLHINLDFQLNSQALAACITAEPCIGGRAWPSFALESVAWEEAVALWMNTTLGLIGFWFAASRQQQGRANVTITRLEDLVAVDPRRLADGQLAAAGEVFERFRLRRLLPANEAYRDDTRWELDEAVLCEVLGLPAEVLVPLAVLRTQWCEEPSVHGGKSTRPG
ncbi:MAG: hypothetical protein F4110_15330 [Acidimicrobiaceae bacterium]|nr:hypothetical protein [Acidimicrobiaceae bacterium]MYE96115.1 hypothetical protein [Acidimicrobiaceae bacterium]MYI55325.1 hypothetical protein [Acidimicrobiaceae bacterium]MYJ81742.1 hypothetical protein [Acidimicrobiaceae bacterium]